jgi:hypothetical protein
MDEPVQQDPAVTLNEYIEANLPDFPGRYNELSTMVEDNGVTNTILFSLWSEIGKNSRVGDALKLAYVLGVYNIERGLHGVKH